ncbi:MAG: hypothetical protein NT105_23285 [Verrucomicrobia bacterium]|nr:hypothetical protein [Verrucomicrobiota bacterium]
MNSPKPELPTDIVPSASTTADFAAWQAHLEHELKDVTTQKDHPRKGDFDMNDASELLLVKRWPRLDQALKDQQEVLLPVWRKADQSAMEHQGLHRKFARVAVIACTAAVVLAILQMAVARQAPTVVSLALALEVMAVVAGIVAVVIGMWTQGDRKWLCERNRAERLRILKFESLGWGALWASDLGEWKRQLKECVDELSKPLSWDVVRAWAKDEPKHASALWPEADRIDASFLPALAEYYRIKRLAFQAAYFRDRKQRHEKAARPWRHLSRPLFFLSTGFVLVHFMAGWLKHCADARGATVSGEFWDGVEIWSLALAAIIPVMGLGCRVWLGAFEPHRSANLFDCKHRAVGDIIKRLKLAQETPQSWSRALGEEEMFFHNEHHEWLRLMLETEWML